MRNIFLLFIISILQYSCANFSSHSEDIGENYFFRDIAEISPRNSYYKTKIYPKVIDYKFNEKYIIAKQKPSAEDYKHCLSDDLAGRFTIYDLYIKERDTVDYSKLTTPYILKEIKADSLLYIRLKKIGVSSNESEEDFNKIKVYADSIIQNDSFYKKVLSAKINYWIIDIKKNIRFGPYTESEFEKEIKLKNIGLNF